MGFEISEIKKERIDNINVQLKPFVKRFFDILFSVFGLSLFSWLLLLSLFIAVIDTRTNGVFIQERIGQFGKRFKIYKLRTIQITPKKVSFKFLKWVNF